MHTPDKALEALAVYCKKRTIARISCIFSFLFRKTRNIKKSLPELESDFAGFDKKRERCSVFQAFHGLFYLQRPDVIGRQSQIGIQRVDDGQLRNTGRNGNDAEFGLRGSSVQTDI